MGLVAEVPPERPQMSAAPENDFIAEAERMRNGPKHFMKVPGNLPPIGQMKHEKQSVLAQMKKKTLAELREILQRQEKLLANRNLVAKLPDRGARARETVAAVEQLIQGREQEVDLVAQLQRLQLPADADAMEWRRQPAGASNSGQPLDSDDSDQETENTLRLLAERDVPARPAHLSGDLDLYAAQKATTIDRIQPQERFVPFTSTEHRGQNSRSSTPGTSSKSSTNGVPAGLARSQPAGSEDHRYLFREPPMPLPPTKYCQSKPLSLQESLELQQRQAERMRQVQLEAAAIRLAASHLPPSTFRREEQLGGAQVQDYEWREAAAACVDSDDDADKEDDVEEDEYYSDQETKLKDDA